MQISSILERMSLHKLKEHAAQSEWIEIDHVRIHQICLPDHRPNAGHLPSITLVHGLGSNAGSYGKLMKYAHPHFKRILAPSAPAHGMSPYHPCVEDPEALFHLWSQVLHQHCQDGPIYLLGTSLGGAIALRYAIEYPKNVLGLILCSPAGPRMTEQEIKQIRTVFEMKHLKDGARFLKVLFHKPPRWSRLLGLAVRATLGGSLIQNFLKDLTPKMGLTSTQLSSLQVPTLLFWGQSERVLPRSIFERYQTHIPSQILTILEPEGFAHSPQLECADTLLSEVLLWISSIYDSPHK